MVANTLIGTDDDLGDTVATYVFDVRLAHSLLLASGSALTGCLVVGIVGSASHLLGNGAIASVLVSVVLGAVALLAAGGVASAITRLRRSDDLFVVHHFGLARHHRGGVARTRWVDIAMVIHAGANVGAVLPRWNGSDYVCRIGLRDGTATTFDNYIVDAAALGRDIEQRSLL